MSVRVCIVVLCFTLLGLASANTNVVYSAIMNRLNNLQDKLEEVDRRINQWKCNIPTALAVLPRPGKMDKQPRTVARVSKETVLRRLKAMDIKMASMEANVLKILNGLKTCQTLIIRSCQKEQTRHSGTYYMQLLGPNKLPFEVYCEQGQFAGGWIVIQHRSEGKLDFYRGWADYREGFGNLNGDFWLGLEYVYQITSSRPHELLIETSDYRGNYRYAHYDEFEIGDEASNYYLKKLGKYTGNAGDGMGYNKGFAFNTYDRHDNRSTFPVEQRCGAWWYTYCTFPNLNGVYKNDEGDWSTLSWYYFKSDYRALVLSRMMIREKSEPHKSPRKKGDK